MREAERHSQFRPVYDRADFSTSTEHLCQDANRRRRTWKSLALANTFGYISEQTNASKHERTRGTRTDEENRQNKEVLKQGTEALEGIYGSTAKIQRKLWTNQKEIVQLRIRNHLDSVQPFPE